MTQNTWAIVDAHNFDTKSNHDAAAVVAIHDGSAFPWAAKPREAPLNLID